MSVRLFVGNLDYSVNEAELRSHFGEVGVPAQVALPVDRETGRPRGFAFVEFADRAVAEEVIRRFNEIGLHCFEPMGAFYCFPEVSGATGLSAEDFAQQLLAEEHVAVVPG